MNYVSHPCYILVLRSNGAYLILKACTELVVASRFLLHQRHVLFKCAVGGSTWLVGNDLKSTSGGCFLLSDTTHNAMCFP